MPPLCCDRHYLTDLSNHPFWCSKKRQTSLSDPVAVAYVHTTGGKVLEFEDVRPDSIGPSAEHPGVIGIEFNSGDIEIAHVPFVEWWHIEYR